VRHTWRRARVPEAAVQGACAAAACGHTARRGAQRGAWFRVPIAMGRAHECRCQQRCSALDAAATMWPRHRRPTHLLVGRSCLSQHPRRSSSCRLSEHHTWVVLLMCGVCCATTLVTRFNGPSAMC
jgi:hypothetical protein